MSANSEQARKTLAVVGLGLLGASIAEATRKLLGNLFELRDLGPTELKGITGPVRAFAVLRASSVESRFDAMHPGGLTALVGREEELELLLRRWARAKAGEGQVVLLSGEAGIGKSRLSTALMERPNTSTALFIRSSGSSNGLPDLCTATHRKPSSTSSMRSWRRLRRPGRTRRCWPRCCRFPMTGAIPLWSLFPNNAGRKCWRHSASNWKP